MDLDDIAKELEKPLLEAYRKGEGSRLSMYCCPDCGRPMVLRDRKRDTDTVTEAYPLQFLGSSVYPECQTIMYTDGRLIRLQCCPKLEPSIDPFEQDIAISIEQDISEIS